VYIVGMPGMFASAWRGPKTSTTRGHQYGPAEVLSDEEARQYLDGCPVCGADVPIHPIIMWGLGDRTFTPTRGRSTNGPRLPVGVRSGEYL